MLRCFRIVEGENTVVVVCVDMAYPKSVPDDCGKMSDCILRSAINGQETNSSPVDDQAEVVLCVERFKNQSFASERFRNQPKTSGSEKRN